MNPTAKRRVRRGPARTLAPALLLLSLSATPSDAQGLLDALFGSGPAPQRSAVPQQPHPLPHVPVTSTGDHGARAYMNPRGLDSRDGARHAIAEPAQARRGGRYRTMCVRLCDGFYWPVSSAVPASAIPLDRRRCEQRCGEMGRLYIARSGSSEAAELTDLGGRPYTRLPTAFLYRKRLVPGCGCQPAPWSASERMRHAEYAIEEQRQLDEVERRIAEAEAVQAAEGAPADGGATAVADSGSEPAEPKTLVVVRASEVFGTSEQSEAVITAVSPITATPAAAPSIAPETPKARGDEPASKPAAPQPSSVSIASPGRTVQQTPPLPSAARRKAAPAVTRAMSVSPRRRVAVVRSPPVPRPAKSASVGWPGD